MPLSLHLCLACLRTAQLVPNIDTIIQSCGGFLTSGMNSLVLVAWPFACTVISVNMPTPHFYRKYAHPFSEGSFLKILW